MMEPRSKESLARGRHLQISSVGLLLFLRDNPYFDLVENVRPMVLLARGYPAYHPP